MLERERFPTSTTVEVPSWPRPWVLLRYLKNMPAAGVWVIPCNTTWEICPVEEPEPRRPRPAC